MPTGRQAEMTGKRKAGKQEAVKYAGWEKGKEAGMSNCEVGLQGGMRTCRTTPSGCIGKGMRELEVVIGKQDRMCDKQGEAYV